MSISDSHHGDDLRLLVTVTSNGAAKDITGATVAAVARKGSTTVTPTATIQDAAAGTVLISANEGQLGQGLWKVQLRVTLGDETQTVFDDTHHVHASAFAA